MSFVLCRNVVRIVWNNNRTYLYDILGILADMLEVVELKMRFFKKSFEKYFVT